jgi:hypothetical protein
MVISINKAQHIEEYKIKFVFFDGVECIIDFSDFLKSAKKPDDPKIPG